MKIDKVRAIFCIYFTGNCEFRSVNNSTRDRAISTEYRIIVVAVTFAFFFFFNKLVQLSHDLESCHVVSFRWRRNDPREFRVILARKASLIRLRISAACKQNFVRLVGVQIHIVISNRTYSTVRLTSSSS